MKNIFIICLTITGLSISGYGQVDFGLKGGLNYATISTTSPYQPFEAYYEERSTFRNGFHLGISISRTINKKMAVRSELLFSSKGYELEEEVTTTTVQLNYLSLPVLLELKLTNKLGLIVGPEFNYLLSTKNYNDEKKRREVSFQENPFDLGGIVGLTYDFSKKVSVDLRYSHGFLNTSKNLRFSSIDGIGIDENNKIKNRVFQLSFGYAF